VNESLSLVDLTVRFGDTMAVDGVNLHEIALAELHPELAEPGSRVEVEIYGDRRPALVQGARALWDPANERLRA